MAQQEFVIECHVRRWAKWLFYASFLAAHLATGVSNFASKKIVRTVTLTREGA